MKVSENKYVISFYTGVRQCHTGHSFKNWFYSCNLHFQVNLWPFRLPFDELRLTLTLNDQGVQCTTYVQFFYESSLSPKSCLLQHLMSRRLYMYGTLMIKYTKYVFASKSTHAVYLNPNLQSIKVYNQSEIRTMS